MKDQVNKWTPGPWVAALDHNSRPIVWGPGTWQIADCWHTPDGKGWANARLIAAAPELYEALEEMTALASGPTGGVSAQMKRDILAKARAALAKARGAQ